MNTKLISPPFVQMSLMPSTWMSTLVGSGREERRNSMIVRDQPQRDSASALHSCHRNVFIQAWQALLWKPFFSKGKAPPNPDSENPLSLLPLQPFLSKAHTPSNQFKGYFVNVYHPALLSPGTVSTCQLLNYAVWFIGLEKCSIFPASCKLVISPTLQTQCPIVRRHTTTYQNSTLGEAQF